MRTALAAIILVLVAFIAIAGASYLTGYVRLEYDDGTPGAAAPARSAAITAPEAESAPEPVADAPEPALPVPYTPPSPQKDQAALEPPPPAAPEETIAAPVAAVEAAPLDPAIVASARIVGGPGITPVPMGQGELPREAPRPEPPKPPRWEAFHRVKVVEAGRLDLGKLDVELAGLVPPPADRSCRLVAEGPERPCAFLALQALRQRIRALGVECQLPDGVASGQVVATCRLGPVDLGQWLIGQGWASAGGGAPDIYAEAEKQARCAGRGMWLGDPPPSDCPGG